MDTATDTLGFIGLGVMGSRMAGGFLDLAERGTQALYLPYQERYNVGHRRAELDR
jgi:3-hydroxyisobutyrate dehydrogenase-like beta-hydroxyacid dehydrogenase